MPPDVSLLVDRAQAGQRLDALLAAEFSSHSRAAWQKQIKAGAVQVNGEPAKLSHQLIEGDVINARIPLQSEPQLTKTDKPAKILYEDSDILVIDKPAGVLVHPADTGSAPSIVADFASGIDDSDTLRPGVVHRLDKDTSGVMLLAKTPQAKQYLISQFKAHKIVKTYLALIWGQPKDLKATIDLPIGRDTTKRTTMSVKPQGKAAVSHYQVDQVYDRVSLVRVNLETGRTHQIRVHFAHIHHPVVGDTTYSNKPLPKGLRRQFLHASEISLKLPNGEKKTFHSELAADLQQFLDSL